MVQPVGFALFFTTFSTWLCRPGLWLEDLFVRPEHRGSGVGRALLAHLARVGVDRGCGRVEWSALDWNTPALTSMTGWGQLVWTIGRDFASRATRSGAG